MASKKQYAAALEAARDAGYEYSRTNAKGLNFYAHPSGDEVCLVPHSTEDLLRAAVTRMQKTGGTYVPRPKRNTQQIRARAADERAKRIAAKQQQLTEAQADYRSAAAGTSPAAIARLEQLVRLRERELAQLTALMTEIPATAAHRGTGTPRHRTGRTP